MQISLTSTLVRRRVILCSPIAVLILGYLVARFTGQVWGAWAWIPVVLFYWLALGLLIAFGGGSSAFRRWLQPSRGAWAWRVLALLPAVLFIPAVFLRNWQLLNTPWLVLSSLVLALINPWLEEGYWRGLLMDASAAWPIWLSILYSTVCFGLSHPLMLGINAHGLAGLPGFLGTCLTGSLWAIVYWKTRSLRWNFFGHFLADLLSLTVLVFLNLVVLG